MNFYNTMMTEDSNIFNISYKHKTVYVKYYSELKNTDLIISSSQLAGHDKFDEAEYLVWDFSDLTDINHDEYSPSLLTSIAQRLISSNRKIRIAYVTGDIDFRNMINKHLDLSEPLDIDIRLFSTVNEFIVWSHSSS